jgi:hypothetical protein
MFSFLRKTALWILLTPLAFTFLGVVSNQTVLWANHDTFPVSINIAKAHQFADPDAITLPDGTVMLDSVHCIASSKTHLNLLADVLDFHDRYVSVGDLSLDLGEYLGTFMPFVWGALVIIKLKNQ